MSLSKVINDCQIELYKRLNLSEHFNLRATCRSLNNSFITSAATRHSLFLNLGPAKNNTDGIGFLGNWSQAGDGLACPTLSNECCDFLLDTFPNITHLKIQLFDTTTRCSSPYSPIFTQIAYLLDGWSSSLQSLAMSITVFNNFDGNDSKTWKILPTSINGLSSLKVLHLSFIPFSPNSWCNLPILGQLEEFTFQTCSVISKIYKSLVNYALPNENLHTITLKRTFNRSDHFCDHPFLNLDAPFTHKFTSIGDIELTGPQLLTCAPKFTSLKALSLYLTVFNFNNYHLPLNQVTSLIATYMPQVEYLTLRLDFNLFADNDDALFYTPLPSVKMLTLESSINHHTNIFKYLKPRIMFPNLKKVSTSMTGWRCIDCKIDDYFGKPEARRVCRELLERPFEECPKFSESVVQLDMGFWNRLDTK